MLSIRWERWMLGTIVASLSTLSGRSRRCVALRYIASTAFRSVGVNSFLAETETSCSFSPSSSFLPVLHLFRPLKNNAANGTVDRVRSGEALRRSRFSLAKIFPRRTTILTGVLRRCTACITANVTIGVTCRLCAAGEHFAPPIAFLGKLSRRTLADRRPSCTRCAILFASVIGQSRFDCVGINGTRYFVKLKPFSGDGRVIFSDLCFRGV